MRAANQVAEFQKQMAEVRHFVDNQQPWPINTTAYTLTTATSPSTSYSANALR